MKRIGITQRVEIISSYNEKRDCLDQRWTVLLQQLGYLPVPLGNRLDDIEITLEQLLLNGVILTGGNDIACQKNGRNIAPERDAFERELLKWCSQNNVPVLGVCRGMQMLAVYHGGQLLEVERHVGKQHFINTAEPEKVRYPRRVKVNSYHNFALDRDRCGDGLEAWAWADDDTIEAVIHKTYPQVGLMWHPEREKPFCKDDMDLIKYVFEELK